MGISYGGPKAYHAACCRRICRCFRAASNRGGIVLDIDGTSAGLYDSLDVAGNLHLNGGTLDIVFENGFLPQAGETWNILNFTGTGDGTGFSAVVFQNAGNEQFSEFFNGQTFEFATAQSTQTPEPPTLVIGLLILATGSVLRRFLRRR